eukprot:SAG31_NODE_19252_length_608_cov_0.952849_2_plen_77_part_01
MVGKSAVILGDELARAVLFEVVPEYAHLFFIVAWNPRKRAQLRHEASGGDSAAQPVVANADRGKRRHMRSIAAHYNV